MRVRPPETLQGQIATVLSAAAIGVGIGAGASTAVDALDPLPRLNSAETQTHNVDVEACAGELNVQRDQTVPVDRVPRFCQSFADNFIYRYVEISEWKPIPEDSDPRDGQQTSDSVRKAVILPRLLSFTRANLITARTIQQDKDHRATANTLVLAGTGVVGGYVGGVVAALGIGDARRRRKPAARSGAAQ